jgi:hypothetical protein
MSNRNIGRAAGAIQIDKDYFCRLPALADLTLKFDHEFERRYRIPRAMYDRVHDGLLEMDDQYFTERPDGCGGMSASTEQKMTSVLQLLCYGLPADGPIAECFSSDLLEDEWLHLWTIDEALKSSKHYEKLGFLGVFTL